MMVAITDLFMYTNRNNKISQKNPLKLKYHKFQAQPHSSLTDMIKLFESKSSYKCIYNHNIDWVFK